MRDLLSLDLLTTPQNLTGITGDDAQLAAIAPSARADAGHTSCDAVASARLFAPNPGMRFEPPAMGTTDTPVGSVPFVTAAA